MPHAADRLAAAINRSGSPVCVGLDPVFDKLPDAVRAAHLEPIAAIKEFSLGVLRALAGPPGANTPLAPAIKFQSACYERYGAPGVAALESCIAAARELNLIVVLDAKRGDIGISAEHYAASAFSRMHADWLTVSPYLGPDTLEPYLSSAANPNSARGIFVLVRTSNPGSDAFQSQQLADGRTIAELMADAVAKLGQSGPGTTGTSGLTNVGAVVGATKASDAAALRRRMPNTILLIPGYGAQGGAAADIQAMLRPNRDRAIPGTSGVLVTASRSVIYAFTPTQTDWQTAVATAAANLADEIRTIIA